MQIFNSFYYKNKNLKIKSFKDNILSHNQMAAFFSGTDMNTLETEGSERANFLSLIVNNKMECVAKYTRKIIRDYKITYTDSFWKENKFVKGDKKKNESQKTYVETWNLACVFPNQEDIDAIKKLQEKKIVPNTGFAPTRQLSLFDDWDTFYEKKRAESKDKPHSETTKTVKPETTEEDDIYEDVIKDYAIRLITGDIYSTETDIDSCIERMQKKYDTDKEFRENVEGNVEWLCQYIISDMMEDELEFFIDYLSEHAKNSSYMQRIMEGIKIWN